MTVNQHYSVSYAFSVPKWSEMYGFVDVLTVLHYRPPGKFRFAHLGEIFYIHIYIYINYIYDALDNRYRFSISVPGIDCTTFQFLFMKSLKKMFFFNFQKLAGLWLVDKLDNYIAIYGSKLVEGFSAFQCPSCLNIESRSNFLSFLFATEIGYCQSNCPKVGVQPLVWHQTGDTPEPMITYKSCSLSSELFIFAYSLRTLETSGKFWSDYIA